MLLLGLAVVAVGVHTALALIFSPLE